MTEWTNEELNKIGSAEELRIAGMKADGALRKPVIIWVVRIGDALYVRSVRGRTSAWFRGVLVQHAGRIWAGDLERDVTFVEVDDPAAIEQVDAAYSEKYRRWPQYVAPLFVPEARAATIQLLPR